MGSDRKEEEKRKKRRSLSLSPSQDEAKRRKRHRGGGDDDDDDKRKKRKTKDKSHSHRASSSKGKKSKDKHRSKHHGAGDSIGNFQELSNDDYYSKNNEFATWLKEEKKVFFSDLSSESAHKLFSKFVEDWNDRKLESRYYEGIVSGQRSAHNWGFKR